MTGFIIFGLLLSITLGAFMAMIFTSGIKNNIARAILGIIIALMVGFGVVGLLEMERLNDEKRWNNGVCSVCDEELELFDVEHHRNSGDTYYYKCKNGHLVKTSNHFSKS